MGLPKFQTDIQELRNLQDRWATVLDPIVDGPLSKVLILPNLSLKAGKNEISHRLGRRLQGWFVTRQKSTAAFYDDQDKNPHQDLTLIIYSTQNVVVNLAVF